MTGDPDGEFSNGVGVAAGSWHESHDGGRGRAPPVPGPDGRGLGVRKRWRLRARGWSVRTSAGWTGS
jgi:hypothetical protein